MKSDNIFNQPLLARIVGIDPLVQLAQQVVGQASEAAYPPYNIVKTSDTDYLVEIAVAGFAEDELSVETKENVLWVKGTKTAADKQANYLFRGIANRSFSRQFQLAEFVEVSGASLRNGILAIELHRIIPEAQRPRKIEINKSAATPSATETATV